MKTFQDEIHELTRDYYKWLSNNTFLQEVNKEFIEINTPFINYQNDHIQIYVKKASDYEILLTDAGDTINNLEMMGCDITGHRLTMLEKTLKAFGVQFDRKYNIIFTTSIRSDFNHKKHNLLQAILSINDLFYTRRTNIVSLFTEEVAKWLEDIGTPYVQDVKFTGETGYDYKFNFVLAKTKNNPERIIKLINNPDKDSLRQSIDFKDVLITRDFKPIIILNNEENKNTSKLKYGFSTFGIEAMDWTDAPNNKKLFAA